MWEAVRPFLVIGGFFALVVLGYPISFALALISLLFMLLDPSIALWIMVQRAIAGLDSFVFMAIPFFVLTGKIMDTGGVSERLVSLARPMVGHIRGGLAHVTVVVGMFFAGISGSSTAESATLSTVFIPAMRRRGYDAAFATSLAAAASTMGIIIPPSILMVIYGAVANVVSGPWKGFEIRAFDYAYSVSEDEVREYSCAMAAMTSSGTLRGWGAMA